jgi:hypothetical protein
MVCVRHFFYRFQDFLVLFLWRTEKDSITRKYFIYLPVLEVKKKHESKIGGLSSRDAEGSPNIIATNRSFSIFVIFKVIFIVCIIIYFFVFHPSVFFFLSKFPLESIFLSDFFYFHGGFLEEWAVIT